MRRFVAAVVVATIGAVLGTAVPAHAVQVPWDLARCVQGTLSPQVTRPPDSEWIMVSGTATDCVAPTNPARRSGFGVAVWTDANSTGHIHPWSIRFFPEHTGPWQPTTVPFGAAMFRAAGRHAVCVVELPPRAPDMPIWEPTRGRPVACIMVIGTYDAAGDLEATTEPLAVTSPVLSRAPRIPATYGGAVEPSSGGIAGDGDGTCGTCF